MSRIRTDLKPTVKGLKSSSVSTTSLHAKAKSDSTTKLPPVSPRCVSVSPRGSVDLKWTLDMVRGYTIHGSNRPGAGSAKNCDGLQSNRDYEKLYQKYMSLQKLTSQLREELKLKNKLINDLQQKLDEKEGEYNQNLQKHKEIIAQHESKIESFYEQIKGLKEAITERSKETDKMREELAKTKTKYDKKIEAILKENQAKLLEFQQLHKEELAGRDAKISMFKMQLESAMNNNSKERQRQLDELTKELARVTDETELLKTKLRALTKQKQPEQCRNCVALEEALQTKLNELRSKEESIAELLQHGRKMARQLSKQDEFLKLCERASVDLQQR
ncbi:kinesin heavy chain-like [Dendronephthya gigantea]|uniref:kinesin heavy chain-like n=1 Tax=Dendronephthya gigantea TaxID=151771 RepID=UPI00106A989F|nr:kinesin heavy chain-like [Dendronephthya gigantea]